MCGIFAVSSKNNNQSFDSSKVILNGLKRLDYRGHDSWGIAVAKQGSVTTTKSIGKIETVKNVKDLPQANIGIGHTRWATHGSVTKTNAHPHAASDNSFVLAQNGIVENYQDLKHKLKKKGYSFISQTDTEVIVRLIEEKNKQTKDIKSAIRQSFKDLKGRNTIIVLTANGQIVAARNGSPLVVGIGKNKQETYFSSDALSFAPVANKMVTIDNGQLVSFVNNTLEIVDIKSGKKIDFQFQPVDIKRGKVDKEGFDHFMIKEIHESAYVIRQVINQKKQDYFDLSQAIKNAKNVYTIGSGTAGLAAAQTAYYLRAYGKIPAVSLVGAEAQSYFELFQKDDIIIAPSQSGETADVIEVLEIAQKKGVKIASFVNMPGAAMTQMADFPFMANAGPEICVMSTKILVSQIAWGYLLAKAVQNRFAEGINQLKTAAKLIDKYLGEPKNHQAIRLLSNKLIRAKDIFILGKSQNLNVAMEGMVKIIEGTYKHAHGIAAGDLKHYAITIMEKGVPVIFVISNDKAKEDVLNAVSEVKARGATVIGIAPFEFKGFDEHLKVPDAKEASAMINIVPLQLLAYYMTVAMGNNVDKPRNIAKSVTVK